MTVLLTCATLIKQLSQRSEISFSSFHYNVLYLIFVQIKYKELICDDEKIYGVISFIVFNAIDSFIHYEKFMRIRSGRLIDTLLLFETFFFFPYGDFVTKIVNCIRD